ncbi:hypothetical protein ABIE10_002452 [Citrobacter sp. 506]|uniref:hypothetical protein n=1 Tax=Citrobacter sp. 506 TaxID=3156447 RepID=UPI003D24F921
MMSVSVQMPQYQCHKKVWALKIKHVHVNPDGTGIITPEENGFGNFDVEVDYINKHCPVAGGYYVQYEVGYESYSPAEAFESGYARI